MLFLGKSLLRRWCQPSLLKSFHTSTHLLAIEPFKLADIGEGIAECEIIRWFVKKGDRVAQFDKICEVQSDKASVEISSRFDGVIVQLYGGVGDMAKVGGTLVDIDTGGDSAVETATTPPAVNISNPPLAMPPTTKITQSTTPLSALVFATPAVRRISRENNVNLSSVPGTGRDGRILKEDVLDYIQSLKPALLETPSNQPASRKLDGISTRTPLSKIQKSMYKQMTRSLAIPHFGYADTIYIDKCSSLRKEINAFLGREGSITSVKKVSYMCIWIKALSLALAEHPLLNAAVDGEGDDAAVVYREFHNIGVAIDSPKGLVVPSIKNVQDKTILEIAQELVRLQVASSSSKLTMADMAGTTFTISNIGSIGGTYMHPVLVEGQVAIGALGSIQTVPVWEDGKWVPRESVAVSFSGDHRVVDGASMARFVGEWKGLVENPGWMMAKI